MKGCDVKFMVHFDRIERAVFGAKAAVHANVHVDVKLSRYRDGFAGLRIVRPNDPNALGRADFGANPTGSTTNALGAVVLFIIDKEWDVSEFFRKDQFLF